MAIDKEALRELVLFIENDGDLYRQQTTSIIKNLSTKMAKGEYDKDKALKLWAYLMDAGAKKYAKNFGEPAEWNRTFSVETRREAAKEFNDAFLVAYAEGEYADLLPKKYQKK
jgi:hypothetical protein